MATISSSDSALQDFGSATLQQNLRAALSMHSTVETERFSVADSRGIVEVARINITSVGATDNHLVMLSRTVCTIRDEVFADALDTRDKTNAPSVYNNPVTNSQLYIPEPFVRGLSESHSQTMLQGLNRFNAEETVLRAALAETQSLTGKSASYTSVDDGGVTRGAIKLSIADDTRKGIDPIHDLAKQLNQSLGVKVFSQNTIYGRDSNGSTQLTIDPLNVSKLNRLPAQKKELLAKALQDPREFVQQQRKQSGFMGKIQAAFDDTAKDVLSNTTTASQGAARA